MNGMDGWTDRLHFSFLGEHVLFGQLRLKSFGDFLVASLLTVVICLSERLLTFALSSHWDPLRCERSRFWKALWRTCLYWLVTLQRLMYMLISMTFHVGLIAVLVSTLALGQFVIEYYEDAPKRPPQGDGESLFRHSMDDYSALSSDIDHRSK